MDDYERYIPVEMSILGSLIEVKMMQQGLLSKPTLEDFFAHIDELIEQEENSKEDSQMENTEKYERYIPVEMSIVGSLLEIREMRAGRLPEPSLEDFFSEINDLIEQEKANENNTN